MAERIVKIRKKPSTSNETMTEEERRVAATKITAGNYTQKLEQTVYSRVYNHKKEMKHKGE